MILGKWWGDKNITPVLAIHGWQDNANSFDNLLPLLNLSSVLAIDLPGHGHSSHFPEGKNYDFGSYLILLHRIFKYYNWTSVALLGHSFGAALSFFYSSIFPKNVKWLISFECARSLLTTVKVNPPLIYSSSLDSFLRIEKNKKNKHAPAYKLSSLIAMCIEGSLGSVSSAESAITLLKRGTILANPQSAKNETSAKDSINTDLLALVESEREAMQLLSEEEQESINRFHLDILQTLEKTKKNIKNFKLSEEEDKFYTFLRDPTIKAQAFQSVNEELLIEASKHIQCAVLSLTANKGFLYGTTQKLHELTLTNLQKSSKYFVHQTVEGSHHAHLNNPETLSPVINKFLESLEKQ